MKGYINGYNFELMTAQKYYAPPASWSEAKKKETARSRIFSGDWYGARKRDGAWWMFIKDEDGNMMLRGRSKGVNGEYPNKIDWVPHLHDYFNSLPKGTVLLGELFLPQHEQSRYVTTVLGCLKDKAIQRQEKNNEYLVYYVFDVLAYGGLDFYNKPFTERIALMQTLQKDKFVDIASYVAGDELWTTLQYILAEGGEGMVITRGDAKYEFGKRPSQTTLKIKKEIQQTIDAFFTGRFSAPTEDYMGKEIVTWTYWLDVVTGERKLGTFYKDYMDGHPIKPITKPFYYKWAGSMEIGLMKDGQVVPIGYISGVTDEIKANPLDYKGRVIELAAMQIEKDTLKLRHGKMIGFRDDKTAADCGWEQLDQ